MTLEYIAESCAVKLAGNQDQHRILSHKTSALLKRDEERYVRDCWTEYFDQLYTADSLRGQLLTPVLQVDADSPMNERPPSFDEVTEAVAKLEVERHLASVILVW